MAGWSPVQISGRLKRFPPTILRAQSISHEAIYQYIYDESGDNEWMYHYLRRSHPKRKRKFARQPKKTSIPDRIGIEERPEVINRRERYGDWESDTMVFKKQKLALSVQYERKSQLIRINKIIDRTAEETTEALHKTAESVPKELFLSLTFDNGGEGARHTEIKEIYSIDTYFCMAYASWQKGGVENGNGLIRQYFPKYKDMSDVIEEEIKKVQELLNDRPRKGLDYQTPNEVANKLIKGGALNS
jgi:IS30 family transposase